MSTPRHPPRYPPWFTGTAVAVVVALLAGGVLSGLFVGVMSVNRWLGLFLLALGTAGAVAGLAGWLDGRAALVVNADTVHDEDLHSFVDEWDGGRVRVLKVGESSFGPRSGVVASIVPRWAVQRLA